MLGRGGAILFRPGLDEGGGSAPPAPSTEITGIVEKNDANHTAAVSKNLIIYTHLTADRTVTLPALVGVDEGFIFIIKDLSDDLGFQIVIAANGGEKIDRRSTFSMGSGIGESVSVRKSLTLGWVIL